MVPITGKAMPPILLVSMLSLIGVGAGLWTLGRIGASSVRSARASEFSRLGMEVRRIASGSEA